MGAHHHVIGIRDLNGRFKEMMEIKKACEAAEVDYPQEIKDYFQFPEESEDLLCKGMEEIDIANICVEEFKDSYRQGYVIDVSKIPKECKKIKTYISY